MVNYGGRDLTQKPKYGNNLHTLYFYLPFHALINFSGQPPAYGEEIFTVNLLQTKMKFRFWDLG